MIAVALIAVFLFVGWIFLQFPLSEYKSIGLILSVVGGLTAVVIVASTVIVKKLEAIHKLLEEDKNNKTKEPCENLPKEDK